MMPQLHYYKIGDDVTAFSTTRHGGASIGSYASFNVNAYCGDSLEAISANRHSLITLLQLPDERHLVIPHQTHETVVRQIQQDFLLLNDVQRNDYLEGVDAVMTNLTDVCIGVSTADCIPLIIYDREHHAACAVHAGWRGTVARIAEKAIAAMTAAYGSCPATLQAVIGPGISLENFEVGQEVYDRFLEAGFPMSLISRRYAKWHLNLPLCNRLQLQSAGLLTENILDSAICTYDHTDDFFSARRQGIASGRVYTGVVLR